MKLIKEYCCCAIPLLNAGIYITLTEQFVVAVTAGILALVTPPIVGASVPSFVSVVFAALCFVAAGIQLFGFMGVFRESTIVFRRYTTLHSFITTAVFSFSAVFIGISASKHTTAQTKCVATFFPADSSTASTGFTGADKEGSLLCNIFTWVGVGTMAGLWVIMAIFHVYLFFVVSGYGSSQRADHSKYYALYSTNSFHGGTSGAHPTFLPTDNIGMHNIGRETDAWDARESMDDVGFEKAQAQYQGGPSTYPPQPHRQGSEATMYNQQPYRQDSQATMYNPQRQPSHDTMYPGAARTLSPGPTPTYHTNAYENPDPYYANAAAVMGKPEASVRHPAEGSFRRKTPRATPAPQERQYSGGNFDQSFFGPPR